MMMCRYLLVLLPTLIVLSSCKMNASLREASPRKHPNQANNNGEPGLDQLSESETLENAGVGENTANQGSSVETFYISSGRVKDKSNNDFVMRGVNLPVAYWKNQSMASLDRIKELGFNTVRIVWCASQPITPGRCDEKDLHSATDLASLMQGLKERQIVAVFSLQNATGLSDALSLDLLVDYIVSPEIAAVLNNFKDIVIINIANEWHTGSENGRSYVDPYLSAIERIRAAGLVHTLMIDSIGWGQNFSSIQQRSQELLAKDPNIIFSSHMYEIYGNANKVADDFQFIRDNNIPFVVGEFACEHQPGQVVDCNRIMEEASRLGSEYGYLAWSYSGNGGSVAGLDLVSRDDWRTLTAWGERLVNGNHGIRETAKTACFFNPAAC